MAGKQIRLQNFGNFFIWFLGGRLNCYVETSDPDELKMEPTKNTYTIETSDEDEFLLM